MKLASDKRIFARRDLADFIGRTDELGRLFRHARGESGSMGLVMLAEPGAGASEMLRQVYDVLFADQNEIVPFYFEIKSADRTAVRAAHRFLHEFLMQTIAFRRGDSRIVDSSPGIGELGELAPPEDGSWVDRLVETGQRGFETSDSVSFLRNCLGAPLRASGHGVQAFVMIDSLHTSNVLEGGDVLLESIRDIFASADIPFVFAGHRRDLFGKMPFTTMAVERLSFEAAGGLVERLAEEKDVEINDQTRDLIAVQLSGNPSHISDLFMAAAETNCDLNSFKNVEQAYTDEIFGGRVSKGLDVVFDNVSPVVETQTEVVDLLARAIDSVDGRIEATPHLQPIFAALNGHEIVNLTRGSVTVDTHDLVLSDYLAARTRLGADGVTRAMVVGAAVVENVKRAPQLMARFYRHGDSLGLREMMRSFDGRQIPSGLIDYGEFSRDLKGAGSDEVILQALRGRRDIIGLPRIVFAANTAAYYPPLGEFLESERSTVAIGFTDASEKTDVVWIAAEIDSKLEATRELTEFWCDRLEMVALNCNFADFVIWLVAPEGFSPEAIAVLIERKAHGSSRKQVHLLSKFLEAETSSPVETRPDEYELAVPMGEDTEMIAAGAAEEIAKRHSFSPKAINQIKTAVIEACINAAEHSLSPDRRIYQSIGFDGNALTITISNRGLRFADKYFEKGSSDTEHRGWGMKLMKGLMDEVRIEQTDDGTRITMIKKLDKTIKAKP